MRIIVFAAALVFGLLLAYVDSRPKWDDTGIEAVAILAGCGVLGIANPRWAWLSALFAGIWIPLYGLVVTKNVGSLIALALAFAGAYAGVAVRKALATS